MESAEIKRHFNTVDKWTNQVAALHYGRLEKAAAAFGRRQVEGHGVTAGALAEDRQTIGIPSEGLDIVLRPLDGQALVEPSKVPRLQKKTSSSISLMPKNGRKWMR